MKIAVIDYDVGNVQSIRNALNNVGKTDVLITNNELEILESDGVILPGVGAFRKGMKELELRNLPEILDKYIDTGKPLLGICLGMQLLFDKGEEFGQTNGLSFISGNVKKFPKILNDKLPHVGWNEIKAAGVEWQESILKDINNNEDMYFVHSYVCIPEDKSVILSTTAYGGIDFCSSIQKDNIYACQFHPEKSGEYGLKIMSNFADIVRNSL